MKRTTKVFFAVLLSAVLCWSAGGKAAPPTPELISISFAGGSIADYVEAIRKVAPEANIVLASKEVGAIPVPPVKLHAVDLHAALELLGGTAFDSGQSGTKVRVDFIAPADPAAQRVFRISKESRGSFPDPQVRVWNVADIIGPDRGIAESVLTAVETALELLNGTGRVAEVRYHEATGLIVASGPTEALDIIDQVVAELKTGALQQSQLALHSGGIEAAAGLFEWIMEMKKLDDAAKMGSGRSDGNTIESAADGDAGAAGEISLKKLALEIKELRKELERKARRIQKLEGRLDEVSKK